MSEPARPLIVGAGPVGLGASLFLARHGIATRLIETRAEPSPLSKALAVNPRTLELLGPTGVTARMLELGLPVRGACLFRGEREIGRISFADVHPTYSFMLALSQATTERLLAEAFDAAGGTVERGTTLVGCRTDGAGVEVELRREEAGAPETARVPWLLAADGAHSAVRHALGVDFPGASFGREWHLADVPLRTTLAEDRAHVAFLPGGGFRFLIRTVDAELERRVDAPLWRVVASDPEPLARLPRAEPAGEPVWTSSFRVAHRLAASLVTGRVLLAGDAAHVHSPVGARGMNLGLEDAWVLAELVRRTPTEDGFAEYARLRRPVDAAVVRRVELVSRMAAATSPLARLARSALLPLGLRIPFVRSLAAATVAGLDHELPAALASRD